MKLFLQKAMFQIGLKKFLCLKKFKIVISDINGEKILGTFYQKKLQKTKQNKKNLRQNR